MSKNLLIEIGTEELPPKTLSKLADVLLQGVVSGLQDVNINPGTARALSSPRRLAVLVDNVAPEQADQSVEKLGPPERIAYDEKGKPTKAFEGFARTCGTTPDVLAKGVTVKDGKLCYAYIESGKPLADVLPEILAQAIKKLPIAKNMRWGSSVIEFVRPVHWCVVLHSDEVLPITLFGHKADRITYGHRIHADGPISLNNADGYVDALYQAKVMVDVQQRRQAIEAQIDAVTKPINGAAKVDPTLLEEVTNIVEWPKALLCQFDASLLKVPHEALIASMQGHQKCFPVTDKSGALMPYFIAVSNLESKDTKQVVCGNEKVMAARLADAKFFYEQDCKTPLDNHFLGLAKVTFQKQLGTLADKTSRIEALAVHIAKTIGADTAHTARAAQLCKTDLMSNMVLEFPELQGIMGQYYAQRNGDPDDIAKAIAQHYWPRFANDRVPEGLVGASVALADKLDTVVGIFGIGQKPTGSKDPFALRRAVLGIIRICQEHTLMLSLPSLIQQAVTAYGDKLSNESVAEDVLAFVKERLKISYLDQKIDHGIVAAVLARDLIDVADTDKRIAALQQFEALPQAPMLAAAYKRVHNILVKQSGQSSDYIDAKLLVEPAEIALWQAIQTVADPAQALHDSGEYSRYLQALAQLQQPIDAFFDTVMVMAEDTEIRHNRLALLSRIYAAFGQVADISALS